MKKRLLFSFALLIFILTGCGSAEEKKAERAVNNYYDALIEKDYKKAFKELFLYDDSEVISDRTFVETKLSSDEAEKIFLEKTAYLEKQNYEVTDFNIEVEYEDGHSFWHHVEVEGFVNGEPFLFNELVFFDTGKLIISSEDPYISYRNGDMTIKLDGQ